MAPNRKSRNWLWLPVVVVLAYIAWIGASEYFWRNPETLENDAGALIQPATVPAAEPSATRARPDNSGRDATGDAVSRPTERGLPAD